MAIYHLHTSPASRSSGKSAVAMAAYRSGGRLLDERTGEIKDYTRKQGIIETAIFYPQEVKFDRQILWNMAEAAEKRKDARIAREIRIALPHELDQEERSKLVKDFAQELVTRYGIAVDLSIHEPDRQGDNRNFHAHLLLTTRLITSEGLSEKSDLEKSDKALKQAGKLNGKEQITEIRETWQNMCNLALERQGREERISAKSYKKRGMDLEPTIHLGPQATAMERRGIETNKGIWNRIIKKNNLMRILQKEYDFFEAQYMKFKEIIKEYRDKLISEIGLNLQPDPELQPAPTALTQALNKSMETPEMSHTSPEKGRLLSEAIKHSAEDELSPWQPRKLSLLEEIKLRQQTRDKGLKIDKDGLER